MPSEWAPPIPLGWAAAAAAAEDGEAEEEEEAAARSSVAAMSQELSDRRPTQGMPSPAVALLLAAPAWRGQAARRAEGIAAEPEGEETMFCGAGHAAAAAAVEKAREALLLLLLVGRVGESHEPRSVGVACPEPRRAGVRGRGEKLPGPSSEASKPAR